VCCHSATRTGGQNPPYSAWGYLVHLLTLLFLSVASSTSPKLSHSTCNPFCVPSLEKSIPSGSVFCYPCGVTCLETFNDRYFLSIMGRDTDNDQVMSSLLHLCSSEADKAETLFVACRSRLRSWSIPHIPPLYIVKKTRPQLGAPSRAASLHHRVLIRGKGPPTLLALQTQT
jgi:hypothetical protein